MPGKPDGRKAAGPRPQRDAAGKGLWTTLDPGLDHVEKAVRRFAFFVLRALYPGPVHLHCCGWEGRSPGPARSNSSTPPAQNLRRARLTILVQPEPTTLEARRRTRCRMRLAFETIPRVMPPALPPGRRAGRAGCKPRSSRCDGDVSRRPLRLRLRRPPCGSATPVRPA
jgi:hypothetical protein